MDDDAPSKQIRSPSYPSISLRDAVVAVGKIEERYRTSPVDREVAVKILGYSSLSGPASKSLAALASYDLVERAGKGELRVTQRAKAILYPKEPTERAENLRSAALNPQLFQELQDRFPGIIPPEDGVVSYLNRQGFNQSAIRTAVRAYLETMSYLEEVGASKNYDANRSPELASGSSAATTGTVIYGGARVGDLVQWESQGVLQFEKPRRVRDVSDDGEWIAVEASETGIPMKEVIVDKSSGRAPQTSPPTFPLSQTSTPTGEVEWIRNKVGPETNVRLLVSGDMGPKEIGKLIKLLEAQKLVLEDE